jgi:glycosyltransferase involved in cell wall biosynthesis
MTPIALTGPPSDGLHRPDRLRVGILAPPWLPVPPAAYGGTENMLDNLARGIQALGHEVVLFSTGDATCPVPRAWSFEKSLGVAGGGPLAEVRQAIDGYRVLRAAEVDVVHDHTLAGPLYAGWFPDLAVVTTNHGPFDRDLGGFYQAVSDRIAVIAISAHQASTAPPGTVTSVVHHGVDVDNIPVGSGNGGYAAFVGRMHPDKGVDRAITAARAAGIPLLIAAKMSEPHEREYFDAAVAPRLGGGIEYVGEVSRADKFHLLGAATCLLNPIRWAEPFGMVMIESLACGTPVVATPAGSAPEIVSDGETGYLCADAAALVDAIPRAASLDRERCRVAAAVRFSSTRMAADHVRVYRAAIATTQSATGGTAFRAPAEVGLLASPGMRRAAAGSAA